MIQIGRRPLSHVIDVRELGARGDGVADDTAAIQAALDLARDTGGGTVYVPPGVYLIKKTLWIHSLTRLELHPKAVIRRGAAISAMLVNGSIGMGGYDGASDIEIVGGTWDANNVEFPAANVTIMGFGHARRITVRDIVAKNIYNWHAIGFNGCEDCKVLHCVFTGMTFDRLTEFVQIDGTYNAGAFPFYGPYDKTVSRNILVQGCVFRNGPRGVGSHYSEAGVAHEGIRIVDCYFESLAQEAVYGYDWRRVVVQGCQFKNVLRGVHIYTSKNTCDDIVIANNTFQDINADAESRAVWVQGRSGLPARNVVIQGNVVNGAAKHGIDIQYCEDVVIQGNVVRNCQQAGIWPAHCDRVQVVGNIAHGNGAGGASGTATAMDVSLGLGSGAASESQDILCANNTIGKLGVWYCTNAIVMGNNILESLTDNSLGVNVQKVNNMIAGTWTP